MCTIISYLKNLANFNNNCRVGIVLLLSTENLVDSLCLIKILILTIARRNHTECITNDAKKLRLFKLSFLPRGNPLWATYL